MLDSAAAQGPMQATEDTALVSSAIVNFDRIDRHKYTLRGEEIAVLIVQTEHEVVPFDRELHDVAQLHAVYSAAFAPLRPAFDIPLRRFRSLLLADGAKVFVAQTAGKRQGSISDGVQGHIPIAGFGLTYTIRNGASEDPAQQHLKGGLAMLCVHPSHQRQGLGAALHSAALTYLTDAVRSSLSRSSPAATQGSIMLGSVFPRIFPGLPALPELERTKAWLGTKGWELSDEPSADLYRSLPGPTGLDGLERDMRGLTRRAEESGLRAGEYNGDREGLTELEKEWGYATTLLIDQGWPDNVMGLVDEGNGQDIHCLYDSNGKIIGATVAALNGPAGGDTNRAHRNLTWPSILGERCGIIGCVGISSSHRSASASQGAGTALVASATLALAKRGADGCFVDWVRPGLLPFYGRVGYEVWERYWVAERIVRAA